MLDAAPIDFKASYLDLLNCFESISVSRPLPFLFHLASTTVLIYYPIFLILLIFVSCSFAWVLVWVQMELKELKEPL